MATVLVIDHDFGTRKRLTKLLVAEGYDVRVATGRGVEIGLGPDLPAAVLISLRSDRTSTQNLCMAIRQSFPSSAVIVLGPNIDVRIKVAFLELGADDYIVQPFDSSEMLARLSAVIGRYQWTLGCRRDASHAVLSLPTSVHASRQDS
jgi:DNA-binding response OmpR family regulator